MYLRISNSQILQVMGYSDTDVAEYLYKNKPDTDSLVKFLCKDLTGSCSRKPPKVPKVIFSDFYMLFSDLKGSSKT